MQGKVNIQITMTARLDGVDVDDVGRIQGQEPGELLGALRQRGIPVRISTNEIHAKPREDK